MSPKINEAALNTLLHTQNGPVGLLVERKAREVTSKARRNARIIVHRHPPAAEAVGFDLLPGPRAVVGVRGHGSIAQYLADKAAGKITPRSPELFAEGWLKAALRGFGD